MRPQHKGKYAEEDDAQQHGNHPASGPEEILLKEGNEAETEP